MKPALKSYLVLIILCQLFYLNSNCIAVQITLDFDSLPNEQGWLKNDSTCTVNASSVDGDKLAINTIITNQENACEYYSIFNAIDPTKPFSMSFRAKIVSVNNSASVCSFQVWYGYQVWTVSLLEGKYRYSGFDHEVPFNTSEFHDYLIEGKYGDYFRIYVDGYLIDNIEPAISNQSTNRISFGDGIGGGINIHSEISKLEFKQGDEHLNLTKHYSPIIYQHVDTSGDHSLSGKSDLILGFDYDNTWRGDVKWENLDNHIGPTIVYYSVIETTNYWFIYYAIYRPRDWSNLTTWGTMHENDMEAVFLIISKGNGYPGDIMASMSMSHNVWLEYPIDANVTALNRDGRDDDGVTFIHNKSATDFVTNGHHPRVFIQSRGHGIFMDENGDECLNAGNAMEINRWDINGFPSALEQYKGTGIVYYCSLNDEGDIISNIWDKIINSGGLQPGPADNYPGRWAKYQLLPITNLWTKRSWKVATHIDESRWMFTLDDNMLDAFFGPSPGNNEAHPPWSMPAYSSCGCGIIPGIPCNNISEPGELLYDPLSAIPKHFDGFDFSGERYVYNPFRPNSMPWIPLLLLDE